MTTTRTDLLPELSNADIDRIEHELFARIEHEESLAPPSRRRRTRRRTWLTVTGVAAAFAVGVLVAPPLLSSVSPVPHFDAVSFSGDEQSRDSLELTSSAGNAPEMASEPTAQDGMFAAENYGADVSADGFEGREIIASGNATVHVHSIAAASDEVAALASTHGGYVESASIGEEMYPRADAAMPVPPGGDYGWVSIRVPSAALSEVMADLADIGEVRNSSVSRYDVTTQAIDLRARVDATRASVERLTELMAQTGSVSELIEAEMALSDRQAQLESYEQQLASLEDQVAMSSLSVELVRIVPVTQADPTGFTDGFAAGWNGLIVSINALVIAAGFVIPWLAVIGIAVLVIWLVLRARRARRQTASAEPIAPATE